MGSGTLWDSIGVYRMAQDKITVVGAGNVGATTAHIAASRRLGQVVLLDIVAGLAEGKALDMAEASPIYATGQDILGTTDWAATADSDVVIITSGVPRKPGMSRDNLLATNTGIVKSVSEKIAQYSPNAFVVVVCNPLDAMVHAAAKTTGFPAQRVMGMAGALDAARFSTFLALKDNLPSLTFQYENILIIEETPPKVFCLEDLI